MNLSSISSFIPILWLVTLTLAEPPVGDGYPSARSSHEDHEHHASNHQRSPSQEYDPPVDTFEYNAPNARASSNARGRSKFPPATVRVSFNQKFSSAAARNSKSAKTRSQEHTNALGTPDGSSARSLSQEYGAPSVVSARTLSTEYGMPDARSAPSQEYGVPVVAARNGVPKSFPSEEYGVPVVAARSNQNPQLSNFRSAQSSNSHDHATPITRSQFSDSSSHGFSAPAARPNEVSQGYDAHTPAFGTRKAPSSMYGAPFTRSQSHQDTLSARNSGSQNEDLISQTYGAPNQREVSETYGAPNARSLSQEYGVPSSRSNLMTDGAPSSIGYASSRSSPSLSYLPASRSAPPSEQYGTPEQNDDANQGYDYANRARALEEELLNQEPASYDFGYQIEDQESGSDFGHTETREANKVQGSYFVVRADGSKQTVEYEADERGFKPRISVEPADAAARSGGYDDNAQELARTASGPY